MDDKNLNADSKVLLKKPKSKYLEGGQKSTKVL